MLSIDLDTSFTAQLDQLAEDAASLGKADAYRQRIPVSERNGIPLVSLELAVDDTGARLDVGFKVPISFQVGQFSGANSITVILLDGRR